MREGVRCPHGHRLENQLTGLHDSIVFVDEGLEALGSDDFAREAKKSGNYFVIFSRNELCNLPYSVNEIYRIKTSGKYHSFVPLYKEGEGHRYSLSRALPRHDFDVLVTKDFRSGLRFYSNRFEGSDLRCESAKSNSGIMAWLLGHADEHVFVIADGAAFGPYTDRVLKLQREHPANITVCLPAGVVRVASSQGGDRWVERCRGHVGRSLELHRKLEVLQLGALLY